MVLETMVAPDIEKEAQEFKAGKTGDEAWAEKMIARGTEERTAEEGETSEKFVARRVGGVEVAQVDKLLTKTETVNLEFSRKPDPGTVLRLNLPTGHTQFYSVESPSKLEEGQIESLTTSLKSQLREEERYNNKEQADDFRNRILSLEKPVYLQLILKDQLPNRLQGRLFRNPELRAELEDKMSKNPELNREEVLKETVTEDMRDYLTQETIDKLGIQRTEAQPEAERVLA